ncbi:hypothetical protein EYR40_002650 [Pleurotus pulmonarius]|nr:hypothetical protein EYR40_002650 [Pleurotus pulmonarius]
MGAMAQEKTNRRTKLMIPLPVQKSPGLTIDDATLDGNLDASQEDEKLQSALPDSHVPLGLIATLALSDSKGKFEEEDDDDVGVANETYFMPGPATDLSL